MNTDTPQARYRALLDQLWQDRAKPEPVNWMALWCEARDLSCGISYLDSLHESLVDCLRECERAYTHKDAVAFRNVLNHMRQLRKDAFDADDPDPRGDNQEPPAPTT